MYLKSPRRRREKIIVENAILQSIVVYLKSPRRRRDKNYCRKRYIAEYRCVPKIASPEARKKYCRKRYRKNNNNNAGSGGRGGSYPTMLSCVQAAAEKETQKPWFWEKKAVCFVMISAFAIQA